MNFQELKAHLGHTAIWSHFKVTGKTAHPRGDEIRRDFPFRRDFSLLLRARSQGATSHRTARFASMTRIIALLEPSWALLDAS